MADKATEVLDDIVLVGNVLAGGFIVGVLVYKAYKHIWGSSAKAPTPAPIDLTFADTVLKDLVKDLKLDLTAAAPQGKKDRHKAFFIYRRARDLGIADAALRQGPGLQKLKQQVTQELDQVKKFLEEKLGTREKDGKRGPYNGGPPEPELDTRHLDLGKFTSVLLSDPPATTEKDAVEATSPSEPQARTLKELDKREMRVFGIVFRAAAIDTELWKGTGNDSKLQKYELMESLDRRLRTVERLHYEASAGASPDGIGSSFIQRSAELSSDSQSTHETGWHDDIRHRMFEAPSIPQSTSFLTGIVVDVDVGGGQTAKKLLRTVGELLTFFGSLVRDPASPRFSLNSDAQRHWYHNRATNEFDWNKSPGTRLKLSQLTRVAKDKNGDVIKDKNNKPVEERVPIQWELTEDSPAGRGYGWIMKPRKLATEAIKELFLVFSQDLWDRSWLHSDGVMSALHLEALQLALRRRKAKEINDQLSDEEKKRLEQERLAEEQADRSDKMALEGTNLTTEQRDEINKRMAERFTARLERNGKREEDLTVIFNELPKRFSLALDDYFQVRRAITRAPNGIMGPGRTDHFENSAVPFDDLQIGDQVLFETSPVLHTLGLTAWDYPTVLVTEIDSFPNGQTIDPTQMKLQGFGTAELEFPSFQLLLTKTIDAMLKGVQEHIQRVIEKDRSDAQAAGKPFVQREKIKWDTGVANQSDFLKTDVAILRLWNPYGDQWDDPGPWWIWMHLRSPMWRGTPVLDVMKILARSPGGIMWLPDKGVLLHEFRGRSESDLTIPVATGFQEPPGEDVPDEEPSADPRTTIFVPLFAPDGGWVSYFNAKAKDPKFKVGPRLESVISDSAWQPGFAMNADKVRVIRPRLKPAS